MIENGRAALAPGRNRIRLELVYQLAMRGRMKILSSRDAEKGRTVTGELFGNVVVRWLDYPADSR